jgi:pescadillo protein
VIELVTPVAFLQVWAIRTHALRKVFLSIKGIYYECEVPSGESGSTVPVRWLEPYEFTQHVPSDVDFRILLTFLDLYRTLTSFVLYKLYTDENLVYPPPMDVQLDQRGEGVGKFKLVEREADEDRDGEQPKTADGKRITKKDVKRGIKSVQRAGEAVDEDEDEEMADATEEAVEEEFVHHPGKNEDGADAASGPLPTYTSLLVSSSNSENTTPAFQIFSPYTFYLSRETSSRTWEFIIRAFGGKVVTHLEPTTDATQSNSLAGPEGDKITHVIIDRPMGKSKMRELQGQRKWAWVQPQWVADCANRREILPSGQGSGYEPGGALPPHLSPWDGEGEVYRPWLEQDKPEASQVEAAAEGDDVEMADDDEEEEEEDEDEDEETVKPETKTTITPALLAASRDPTNETLIHQAELEAESHGISHDAFKKSLDKLVKEHKETPQGSAAEKAKKVAVADEDMRKIMMTGKKQRLYTKMTYSNNEKKAEVSRPNRVHATSVIAGFGIADVPLRLVLYSNRSKTSWSKRGRPSRRGRRRRPSPSSPRPLPPLDRDDVFRFSLITTGSGRLSLNRVCPYIIIRVYAYVFRMSFFLLVSCTINQISSSRWLTTSPRSVA